MAALMLLIIVGTAGAAGGRLGLTLSFATEPRPSFLRPRSLH